jgi:hypothetical protein
MGHFARRLVSGHSLPRGEPKVLDVPREPKACPRGELCEPKEKKIRVDPRKSAVSFGFQIMAILAILAISLAYRSCPQHRQPLPEVVIHSGFTSTATVLIMIVTEISRRC